VSERFVSVLRKDKLSILSMRCAKGNWTKQENTSAGRTFRGSGTRPERGLKRVPLATVREFEKGV